MAETTSPAYYQRGSIQVWDFIRDQSLPFHLGNAIKYICRAGHKGSKTEDLKKAIVYLQNELEHAERENLSRYNAPDTLNIAGSGVQGGLSPDTITFGSSAFSPTELDYGGVQGVFGGGSPVVFN